MRGFANVLLGDAKAKLMGKVAFKLPARFQGPQMGKIPQAKATAPGAGHVSSPPPRRR
jgi:hypothetical protein